jgi:hypothetical protein
VTIVCDASVKFLLLLLMHMLAVHSNSVAEAVAMQQVLRLPNVAVSVTVPRTAG